MSELEVDWDRTVFSLLAPDAIARRVGDAVLDRMVDAGFRPVGWRGFWHRPADLDAFNERNITQVWHGYLYRLIDQLFASGPTIAMLLHDDRPDPDRTSHQRMRAVKGPSEPAEAGPDTIRGALGSINVMLALMHSADPAADARHESGVFTSGTDGFAHGDPEELFSLVRLLQAAAPAETRGYPEVLAGVRARMLATVWDEWPAAARRAAAAFQPDQLALPGAGKRLADLLPDAHPLGEALRADFSPTRPGPTLDRVRLLLRGYGTDIDPWEDLVLAT